MSINSAVSNKCFQRDNQIKESGVWIVYLVVLHVLFGISIRKTIFLSADPPIGWDEWGCGVMGSETQWFSIMPESKWKEGGLWEMTKVGDVDYIWLIQGAQLLQLSPGSVGQTPKVSRSHTIIHGSKTSETALNQAGFFADKLYII